MDTGLRGQDTTIHIPVVYLPVRSSSLAVEWEIRAACDGSSAWRYTDKVHCAGDQSGGWDSSPSTVTKVRGECFVKNNTKVITVSIQSPMHSRSMIRSGRILADLRHSQTKTLEEQASEYVRNPRTTEASELAVAR